MDFFSRFHCLWTRTRLDWISAIIVLILDRPSGHSIFSFALFGCHRCLNMFVGSNNKRRTLRAVVPLHGSFAFRWHSSTIFHWNLSVKLQFSEYGSIKAGLVTDNDFWIERGVNRSRWSKTDNRVEALCCLLDSNVLACYSLNQQIQMDPRSSAPNDSHQKLISYRLVGLGSNAIARTENVTKYRMVLQFDVRAEHAANNVLVL